VESESPQARTPTLQQLIHEERVLSRRRTQLQRRIDFLRSGGDDGSGDAVAGLIAALEEEEREVSRRRRELHDRIEVARANARRSRA
jgi:hypothetical protein